MKTPSKLDYSTVPGVKSSGKTFIKAVLRKIYLKPRGRALAMLTATRESLKNLLYGAYTKIYHLPIDEPIYNKKGMKGVFLVASYTDKDKQYLPGMIEASAAFGGIILYHDRSVQHDFKYNESLRFQLLIAAAKRAGADWVLLASPKTRFSSRFRDQIEPFIREYTHTQVVLGLKERYLWEAFDQYAYPKNVEGDAIIYKFFTITDNLRFDNLPIHAAQHPINYTKRVITPASRFYLGRFNIKTMKQKADFYNKKDGKDYSYLYDVASPIRHEETVLGIGDFEKSDLIS